MWAFRKEAMMLVVNTNNGVERQNKEFKLSYMKDIRDKSVSSVATTLVKSFLPDRYKRY